ncbi:steroid 17-alpha-hydroxylase/17,20 lyase-like [Saccostrea echinata]|uniref:steroid 17-alpha-hydroxylase/17,20 lyase-like n=1 Tax=Saccostrea echinata TaxID=191078 RepID=UPI002A81B1E0|nr:steroid 17-alpha-hydroxylase/17,20 lyase-like [Saccostrea echinata]
MAIIYILLMAIICFLTILVLRWQKQKPFPGPKGWPVLGVLLELDLNRLYITFDKWGTLYGDVFQFMCLGRKFVCVNSSDIIRDILLHEPTATHMAGRPEIFVEKYFYMHKNDVVFSPPDKQWAKRRKLLYKMLNAYGEGLVKIEHLIKENLLAMKDVIDTYNGHTIDPSSLVERFILDTVEVLLIGKSSGKHGELKEIMKDLDVFVNESHNLGPDMLYNTFPFLRFLPFQHTKNLENLQKTKNKMMDMLEKISNNHPESTGVYLLLKKLLQERDKSGQPWFSEVNLWCLIVNIVSSTYLTSRGTLLSLIQILAKRPDLQKSIQREIDNVIGVAREPDLKDRQQCHLVEAVILETLRYIPVSPVAFHSTTDDTEVNGVLVEKNTTVLCNFWTVHHSEKEWKDPLSFNPERFLQEDGSLLPSTDPARKRILTFGLGKRSCIGEVFAKSRMFLFVATLLQSFSILEPEDKTLPDLLPDELAVGIILQPNPYKVRFVSRKV